MASEMTIHSTRQHVYPRLFHNSFRIVVVFVGYLLTVDGFFVSAPTTLPSSRSSCGFGGARWTRYSAAAPPAAMEATVEVDEVLHAATFAAHCHGRGGGMEGFLFGRMGSHVRLPGYS